MKVGSRGGTRSHRFGDVALVIFLLAQALDGVLTYVGVSTYGLRMEGNPFIGWLMSAMGEAAGLATAKLAAAVPGDRRSRSPAAQPAPSAGSLRAHDPR